MATKVLAVLLIWFGLAALLPVLMSSPLNIIFALVCIIDGILFLIGR